MAESIFRLFLRHRIAPWDNLSGHSLELFVMSLEHLDRHGMGGIGQAPFQTLQPCPGQDGRSLMVTGPLPCGKCKPEYKAHIGFPKLWGKKREREREYKILMHVKMIIFQIWSP